jgi:DNA polymerase III delta subunit
MYKNIIYITGNNSYAISKEVKRWIKVFEMKHWNENIDRIALDDRTRFPLIRDNLQSGGLFSEKRLFVFSGGIEKKVKWDASGIEWILEHIAKNISEDHFLLFHHVSQKEEWLIGGYDERWKVFTPGWLQKNAEIRRIDTLWDIPYWEKEYTLLDKNKIKEVLSRYQEGDATREITAKNRDLGHLVANSLELLSLAQESSYKIVDESIIYSEWWYNIFNLTDAILDERYKDAVNIFHKLAEHSKTLEILLPLIGNLRNTLYIKYLQSCGKTSSEIAGIVKVHSFVLSKNLSARISWKKIWYIYKKLVSIDKAYKSGKWLQDSELWRIFSIDLVLLELKK